MHESSIARQLLQAVLARAEAEGAVRVRVATACIAEAESLSAQSIGFHFDAHARGTVAHGARLDLKVVQIQARCGGCEAVFAADHHVAMCPQCGKGDGELLGQPGVRLESMEIE